MARKPKAPRTEFEMILDMWEAVKVDLMKTAPQYGAFLEHGKLVSMTKEEIILGFQENQGIAIERCRSDPAQVAIVNAVMKKFKRPFVVKIIALRDDECHRGVKDDFGVKHIMHQKIRT